MLLRKIADFRLVRLAASVRLYIYLSVLIVAGLIFGTLFPQQELGQPVPAVGGVVELMLQPHNVYHSWWFVSLLCLLALNVLCCTLERFSLRVERLGAEISHIGLVLVLLGGAVTGYFGQRTSLTLRVGQQSDRFHANREHPGFALRLDDFKLTLAEANKNLVVCIPPKGACRKYPAIPGRAYQATPDYRITVLKFYPNWRVSQNKVEGAFNASDEALNPALQVEVNGRSSVESTWLFAQYPAMQLNPKMPKDVNLFFEYADRGQVADFASTVSVIADGQTVTSKTIRVNDPLRYGGYSFYQSQYNPRDLQWTGLEVVRDPGVPVVNIGFCMVILGITFSFYIKPYFARREEDDGRAAV